MTWKGELTYYYSNNLKVKTCTTIFFSTFESTYYFSGCSLTLAGVHVQKPNLTAEEVELRSPSKDPSTARVDTSTVLDMV